jgi:ABC-type branched-subunit amino acid transport system ATPase component
LLLAGLPLLLWFGSRGEVAARFALRRLLQLSGGAAATSGAALALAVVSPSFALAALLAVAGLAGFGLLLATSTFGLLALCEPARRPYAAAGLGLASVMGGIIGRVAMVTIGNRFGVVWALEIAAMVLVGLGRVGPVMRTIDADLDALVARMVELDELGVRRASGAHIPLLDCRHIDFAYGPLQVLFDVSLSVDEGEMVALLGTNGAGKSTLLRLISGLNVPHAGSIHYAGVDITFLDTDRRARLGIAQVPGGRAVFGPLTVVENLRAYGHTHGRDHRRVDQGIEAAFAAFPQLAEQRHSRAGLLSGGEQQMLGLAAAYILRPRLLLIDELSLGLAPIVIGELLDMVTRINDAGTAVVVVEQSVNIALSVVSHAYFMEKGEMRFDGRADDLVRRPDLLRSVFLEGTRAASVPIGARRSAARKVRA